MPYKPTHLSITINRPVNEVYEFLSTPENMPKWAAGLSETTMRKNGDLYETDSPMGVVKIKFSEKNHFGVVDHDVILPSGEVNHNPLRVVKNGEGSEVIFTLYRLPRMSDEEFERDARMVEGDLFRLREVLEEEKYGNI